MSDDQTTPISLSLRADEKAALDEWRRSHPDLPSRPRAIRELLKQALGGYGAGLSGEGLRHV